MTSNRISIRTGDHRNVSPIDRVALSRAQHRQLRENRPKSISDDEIGAISDWSDSDRECCPLSDFESTSYIDDNEDIYDKSLEDHNNKIKVSKDIAHSNFPLLSTNLLNVNQAPYSISNNSATSTRISFAKECEGSKQKFIKKPPVNSVKSRKQYPSSLLPARRIQTTQTSPRRPSTRSTASSQTSYITHDHKTAPFNLTRLHSRRDTNSTSTSWNTHLTKSSTISLNYSFQSHDDNPNQRQIISPNLSQSSVPRVYEIKKIFVDDYDYGRLTDLTPTRPSPPRSRQKWGTIIHPPFPLGYQHIASEQLTRAVERLSNPVRCRDRHTCIETPSKRYLSAEETEALVRNLLFFVPGIFVLNSFFR